MTAIPALSAPTTSNVRDWTSTFNASDDRDADADRDDTAADQDRTDRRAPPRDVRLRLALGVASPRHAIAFTRFEGLVVGSSP